MNIITPKNSTLVCALKPAGPNGTQRLHPWRRKLAEVALAVAVLLTAVSSHAAQLIWDAGNTANGATIDAASGAWDTDTTTNLNWNNGSGNVSWTQTSTTVALNGATFAGTDAAAGTYQIALDGPQIAWNNLTISANGYAFSGATMYQPSGTILSVADGKSVTFGNNITGNNAASNWRLGAGGSPASMILMGSFTSSQFAVGSTNGSTLWLAGGGSGGVFTINANVTQTNGTWANSTTWQVGRPGASTQPDAGKAAFPGVYTLDGAGAILNLNNAAQISRSGGSGTVIIKNGTVNMIASALGIVSVLNDNSAGGQGSFFMQGGTLNVGNSSGAGSIALARTGAGTNSRAIFSQSGGTIKAWGGIAIGAASGTFNVVSTIAFTNSGGFLYIGNVGSIGISRLAVFSPTNYFVLSGGTVGALQSWISTVPLQLDMLNGNITFQCADDSAAPFNIGLSGALTGPGGLYKTGGGTLTLSGANNYEGSTVVSNGILKIVPLLSPTNGSLTLDGSAGSPSVSVAPASAGQFMAVNGNLTYAAGTVTANFDFGALPPSFSVAPIQVTNNVVCTVTPDITIVGSSIPVGTYPLIKYGGTVTGSLPTTPISLPASTTGYITNKVAAKIIALVVTSSPVSASLTWRVGSGNWGLIPAQNWSLFGSPINYTEPNAVQFDDTASGPFPIIVTNVSAVNPNAITVLGTNVWTITGNGGSIDGVASLTKAGNGTVTLTGTNTYSGGTSISGGQLNLNNGGNSAANSAIGTGPLTLALGSKIDNTSGQSVTLQPIIAQNWLDDWTFVGSTNLNTGAGAITLGSSVVVLTVVSNTLEVDGAISDGGNIYRLEKAGNGTLTLGTDNSFTGGLTVDGGQLNLKTANCLGNGVFNFNASATLDNLSGGDLAVTGITGTIGLPSATVTYLGISNSLSLPAQGVIAGPAVFNVVSNALSFNGIVCGNSQAAKIGAGTLALTGSGSFIGSVNQGELDLGSSSGASIGTGGATYGLLVQSNAVAKITGFASQFMPAGAPGTYPVPCKLSSGGVLDLNGNSQTISQIAMTNGVLRNSLTLGFPATLTIPTTPSGLVIGLAGMNTFDVPSADAELDINGNITGAGSLVKTGLGVVNLLGTTNSYTGHTTVSDGTLIINGEFLATNSIVTVNTNATLGTNGVLNLNFSDNGTNIVAALVLGGVSKPAGVYNATTDPLYLAGSGSLEVVPPVTINPLPGTIAVSVSGGTLSLSWPTNAGWILQSQTNALNTGLMPNGAAWFTVPGSDLVTSTNLTINPANGAVFYRMMHP